MKKYLARTIWNASEYFKITLGKYAPKVFGAMIGSKPIKILTRKDIVK